MSSFLSIFAAVQLDMSVNFVSTWIHATHLGYDVKMEAFVKLTTQVQYHRSGAGVQLATQLRYAKFQNGTLAIRDPVKTEAHAIWNHFKTMYAHALKDILVSFF